MAYHSDVAIQCEEKVFDALKEILVKAGKNAFAAPDYIFKDDNQNYENTQYLLYWEQISWYDDPVIDQIMKTLKDFDNRSEEEECGYKYIRLGEDIDDVSSKTNRHEIVLSLKIDIPSHLPEIII